MKWLLVIFCVVLFSCKSKNKFADSIQEGTIHISADESFRPVIEEQIKMYENTYPSTKILAAYKSEADCLRDLFYDTATRLIVVTRGLSEKEENFFRDSLSWAPGWQQVATDAIAVVVHQDNPDTLFTLDRLRNQLAGTGNRNEEIVFDGLNATSTVRFIIDSVLKGKNFDTSVVRAAKSSAEAIKYVADHPEAIAMVGISWIGNPEDTAQVNMLRKVKLARVQCDQCEGKPFVKPMQASITTHRYPLVRGLFYINKENFQGLGSGFASFMKSERGQLIFRRSYLSSVMDLNIRRIKMNVR